MKTMFYPALIAIAFASSAFTLVSNTSHWKVADNYSVKAVCPKFEGVFKGLQADLTFDEGDLLGSKLSASIDATSINTGNGMRNKHAQQGLEADKYPTVKFVSTAITKTSSGYEATGKLTIKEVTKEIKLPFTFTKNATGGIFAGKFSVRPADYNVKKAGTPEVFDLQLNVPVTK